jgi:hypothetical protein
MGEGAGWEGEEPYHTAARKPGPLYIIQYSLLKMVPRYVFPPTPQFYPPPPMELVGGYERLVPPPGKQSLLSRTKSLQQQKYLQSFRTQHILIEAGLLFPGMERVLKDL